ncbi:TIGR03118 family protein [Chitinophagaceae bacterium LB-8]|uniref:TIGR03118 family protein n=1 Tax=Paraflavisolibacter caeni TaxID=2982496 RepID=A0A9X3B9C5_9BACT|nr:TIGR03118 family protein [Paraflavisolibacter caeni]MCU7551031.1 TIGR03118 family protein [Paraflavisolibacter caeni]
MKTANPTLERLPRSSAVLFMSFLLLLLSGCIKHLDEHALKEFKQVNLVGNNNEYAPAHIDPVLVNAWGLAFNPTGIAWVSAEEGHVSTIYDKDGNTLRPPVNIPSPGGATGGSPTGIVFNSAAGTNDFVLSNGQRAAFLFAGIDGILSGWNPTAGNNALLIKDESKSSVYTGLAIGAFNNQDYIYAANFKTGKINVWDSEFKPVTMDFKDPGIPAGYAPFNIQSIEDRLYVAYAKVAADGDEEAGEGLGIVSVFNKDGSFVKRFATAGKLNAPWGLAKASASFFADNEDNGIETWGKVLHWKRQPAILVGNFGDGHINAYSLDGEFLGQLKTEEKIIEIEGLWAITFPPVSSNIDKNRLYFTAGPDDEEEGLFGYIVKD